MNRDYTLDFETLFRLTDASSSGVWKDEFYFNTNNGTITVGKDRLKFDNIDMEYAHKIIKAIKCENYVISISNEYSSYVIEEKMNIL